ncbi:MAG: mechanosensitive ion channel family protein [Luteibaculum sp.]
MKIDLDNTPSLKYTLIVFLVIISAFLVSKASRFIYGRALVKWAEKGKIDQTSVKFLHNAISFIIFIAASIILFISIPALKNLGLTLFAGAGIIAAIIGFASQQAFTNIISGFFIVIFKPFRVGDIIQVGDRHQGIVEDITLRHSVIRNYENRRIIIPNSIISADTILNSSIVDEKTCMHIEVGISYGSDISKAMEIFAETISSHPLFSDNRTAEEIEKGEPEVVVRVISLGEYSVNLRAYAWALNPPDGFVLKTDVFKTIKERFDQNGIEIPFPYMNIIKRD